jgi:protein-disulfide isomerase
VTELTSAGVPPAGPDDHASGEGEEAILYIDLGCPYCAAEWARLRAAPMRLVFRHFPLSSKRPRSPALHAAAEAAGRQGRFWEFCDSLFADHGHTDDPHLWERARELDLDLEAFERDRRDDELAARVRADFEGGIRAGVAETPTLFLEGRILRRAELETLGL